MKRTIGILLLTLSWSTTRADNYGAKEQIRTLEQVIGHPEVRTLVDERDYQFFFVPNVTAIDLSALFPSVPFFQPGGYYKPQIPQAPQTPQIPQAPLVPQIPPATGIDIPLASELAPEQEHHDVDEPAEQEISQHPEDLVKVPGPDIGYEVPCGLRAYDDEDRIRIVGGTNALPGKFKPLLSCGFINVSKT